MKISLKQTTAFTTGLRHGFEDRMLEMEKKPVSRYFIKQYEIKAYEYGYNLSGEYKDSRDVLRVIVDDGKIIPDGWELFYSFDFQKHVIEPL